jgi:hypothetical protein
LHKSLVVCCALYLSGAHWMVLQVTAWTGMLVARAPQSGVVVAVETTFDGQHPCNLCVAVTEGQKDERQKQPAAPALGKVVELKVVAFERCEAPVQIVSGEMEWSELSEFSPRRADVPPTPPPLA